MIPALIANQYDAIVASLSITDERKTQVDFSARYYFTPSRFVALEGADFDLAAGPGMSIPLSFDQCPIWC